MTLSQDRKSVETIPNTGKFFTRVVIERMKDRRITPRVQNIEETSTTMFSGAEHKYYEYRQEKICSKL